MLRVKLNKLATVQMGLVLSRKEARSGSKNTHLYSRLTLKSLDNSGTVNLDYVEPFCSFEKLADQIVCIKNDILIRMFAPLNPTIITDETAGFVVPSQIASIRITESSVTPQYLQFYLSQGKVLKKLALEETGSIQRSIKINTLLNLDIPIPSIENQKKICEIVSLSKRRSMLFKSLEEQEQLMCEALINKMLNEKLEAM